MKKLSFLFLLAGFMSFLFSYSQSLPVDSAALKIYRVTPPKMNDLIHMKLDLSAWNSF